MNLKDCHSFGDFRELARRKLPSPIFNYIDGAADDETTYERNTKSFEDCDLVPNVLRGVEDIDMSVCLLYTSPSPRDLSTSRMPSSA